MSDKKLIDLAAEFVKNEEELNEAKRLLNLQRERVDCFETTRERLHLTLAAVVNGTNKNRVFFVRKEKAVLVRWSFANGDPRIDVEVIPAEVVDI